MRPLFASENYRLRRCFREANDFGYVQTPREIGEQGGKETVWIIRAEKDIYSFFLLSPGPDELGR